jgi:glyoxylase-like metal-dependent hydrolase (beta-lactamase superfamily II)
MQLQNLATALAVGIAAIVMPLAPQAAESATKDQPGYYRMLLGEFEITALSDGTLALPVDQLLKGTSPENVKRALQRDFLGLPTDTSVNGFLVQTPTKLVLIDTGAGTLLQPTAGRLVANLRAAGYAPEQVDEIYLTHMHADHIGGLAADGKPVFANAVVRADQREADFWLSPANLEKAPAEMKEFFKDAMLSLEPYVKAGRLKPFDGATELVAGVRSVPTYGHTPGHTSYALESKGEKLLVWGDLIHVAAVQFPDPRVTITFDSDQDAARLQRQKEFADVASGRSWIAAAHLSFPALGHIRRDGHGYVYAPINYSLPK